MNTHARVKEWALKMGYVEKISENLKNMCNPSTVLVWEQLMETVKPKKEVETARNNLLILRVRNTTKPTELKFPINQLKLWQRKRTLQEQILNINESIRNANEKLIDLSNQNKIKYVSIESLQQNIKEQNQKMFLFDRKTEELKRDITLAEEKLTFCKTVTPIIGDQDICKVSGVLSKSAKKIENLLCEQSFDTCKIQYTSAITCQILPTIGKNNLKNETCADIWVSKSEIQLSDDEIRFPSSPATSSTTNKLTRDELLDLCHFMNENLNQSVGDILHENNNYLVWKIFTDTFYNLYVKLMKCIDTDNSYALPKRNPKQHTSPETIFILYSQHIENELSALKCEQVVKKLQNTLNHVQQQIFDKFEKLGLTKHVEDFKNLLLLQKEEAGLTGALACINGQVEELRSMQSLEREMTLGKAQREMLILQQQIVSQFRSVDHKITLYEQTCTIIKDFRRESFSLMRLIQPLINNLQWTVVLRANVICEEVKVFSKFSVEYNRQTSIEGTNAFLKDICGDITISNEYMSSDILYMIVKLIDSPFSPPETILLDLIKNQAKVNTFKSLQSVPRAICYVKHNYEDLKKQESYINYAVNKLYTLMKPHKTNTVLSMPSVMKEIVKLWLEMPLKNFVSDKHVLNHSYYEYYDLYNSFYDKLE